MLYAIQEQMKNCPVYFRDVIKRHFWIKRHAIIRQAEKWILEAQRECQTPSDIQLEETLAEQANINPIHQVRVIKILFEKNCFYKGSSSSSTVILLQLFC